MVEVQTNQAREMQEAVDAHDRRMAELPAKSERDLAKLEEEYKALKEQIRARSRDASGALPSRWREGMQPRRGRASRDVIARSTRSARPGTTPPGPIGRQPRPIPPVLRFGSVAVDLAAAAPAASRPTPALMEGLPHALRAPGPAPVPRRRQPADRDPRRGPRRRRSRPLQAAMFRLLTSLPPGKVRFTIIDPVGLGENFAAFMHLADYDEPLVTSRIWTEPAADRAAAGRPRPRTWRT